MAQTFANWCKVQPMTKWGAATYRCQSKHALNQHTGATMHLCIESMLRSWATILWVTTCLEYALACNFQLRECQDTCVVKADCLHMNAKCQWMSCTITFWLTLCFVIGAVLSCQWIFWSEHSNDLGHIDWEKSSLRIRPTIEAVAVAIGSNGEVSCFRHLECWSQWWRHLVDCRVYILVFSSPDKQRLYCQGEKEAQSYFELANRMRTSGTSHMSGTYWVIAKCATTHGHSRMLYVTRTLLVWGFVLLQNVRDLGNKVCSEACMFDNAGLEPFMAIIGLVDDFS